MVLPVVSCAYLVNPQFHVFTVKVSMIDGGSSDKGKARRQRREGKDDNDNHPATSVGHCYVFGWIWYYSHDKKERAFIQKDNV